MIDNKKNNQQTPKQNNQNPRPQANGDKGRVNERFGDQHGKSTNKSFIHTSNPISKPKK